MFLKYSRYFDGDYGICKMSVVGHGYAETDDIWVQEIFPSPFTRLYFVIDGSGEFILDNEIIKIEPGYVYVAPCDLPYGYRGTPSVKKVFFHVYLTMPDGQDFMSSPFSRIVRFPRSREKLAKMYEWYYSTEPSKHFQLKAEVMRAVSEAMSEIRLEDSSINYSATVSSAIKYIRTHLSAKLKTHEIAQAVFCSVGTLNEFFKNEMGKTVAQYVDDLLMLEARRMLLSTDDEKSVAEISNVLGFCDQFYFSHCFTKRFSMAPRDYRKYNKTLYSHTKTQ